MLRSDLEEAEEKSNGRAKATFRKVLGILQGMMKNLNRVDWSLTGERLREETMLTIDDMRRQIEGTLSSAVPVRMATSEDNVLRQKVIRLAYENPELRPKLLPIIAARGMDFQGEYDHLVSRYLNAVRSLVSLHLSGSVRRDMVQTEHGPVSIKMTSDRPFTVQVSGAAGSFSLPATTSTDDAMKIADLIREKTGGIYAASQRW